VHDDGTLVEDVIYTFSSFRFHLFPLPLRLIFQLREFLGNESDGIACSLLGPAPPLCFSPFPPSLPFHVQKPQFFIQALPGGLRIR
jgi:hypothetical protein